MADPSHYTYRVTWSEPDGEFVGTVAEFPLPVLARRNPERGPRRHRHRRPRGPRGHGEHR